MDNPCRYCFAPSGTLDARRNVKKESHLRNTSKAENEYNKVINNIIRQRP